MARPSPSAMRRAVLLDLAKGAKCRFHFTTTGPVQFSPSRSTAPANRRLGNVRHRPVHAKAEVLRSRDISAGVTVIDMKSAASAVRPGRRTFPQDDLVPAVAKFRGDIEKQVVTARTARKSGGLHKGIVTMGNDDDPCEPQCPLPVFGCRPDPPRSKGY